jgi:predicted flap endonuclease-1-like 5' DNA nuclease
VTDPYTIDLQSYTLDRLKERFQKDKLLPARQVLREDLEERFRILEEMGIHNLAELIAALRTRRKVAAFAARSGLPEDYVVILGREARSFVPKPVYLRDIPGVHAEQVARLAEIGILHSKHVFERARTPTEREALAETTGIPPEALLELVKFSDLARVGGMGPAYVRLLYEAGADRIETLAQQDPAKLRDQAFSVNATHRWTRVVPSLEDITNYVMTAQALPKAIQYE